MAATLLVGGSLFIWLIAVPASRGFGLAEAERTRVIGLLAKRFGAFVYASLAALIGTGILIALIELRDPAALLGTLFGRVLLVKTGLVALLLFLLYLHNVVYGRKIMELARADLTDDLQRLRRKSRPVAYVNVVLLLTILLLGAFLHYVH